MLVDWKEVQEECYLVVMMADLSGVRWVQYSVGCWAGAKVTMKAVKWAILMVALKVDLLAALWA